jgi:hypothetical protein
MILKIHPAIATILIAGIIILLFLLVKGCKQSKLRLQVNERSVLITDSISKVLIQLKKDSAENEKKYNDTLEFINGQYALAQEQKLRYADQLDNAKDTIKKLIAKYKSGKYTDTAEVVVPHEFVADCQDCFSRLERQSTTLEFYERAVFKADSIIMVKDKNYQNRIKKVEQERDGAFKLAETSNEEHKKSISKLAPRRLVLFSWNVLSNPWPCAVGIGGIYQDKRNRQFGVKKYIGNIPNAKKAWELEVNMPLSFKKR